MYLLDNEMAPLTFDWGFVEADFDSVCDAFLAWKRSHGRPVAARALAGELRDLLAELPPITFPHNRYLLTRTQSRWTAYFGNGLRGPEPGLAVGVRCEHIKTHGLAVSARPTGYRGVSAGTRFVLYGPEKTEWLNVERAISAEEEWINTWEFETLGEPLAFEDTERYRARRIRDRLTPEMVATYCREFGIRLFDPDFYGPEGLLVAVDAIMPPGAPVLSLAEARRYLGIE